MTEWYATAEGLWARAWELFTAAGAPRYIALATQGAAGPSNRLVVIREADPDAAMLTLYTDAASTKIGELRADPRAALAYWRSADALQVRLEGRIEITTGAALRPAWTGLSEQQRGNYGVMPPPGTPIPDPHGYVRTPDFAKFARLTFTAETIDIVHLSPDAHRRALFARHDGWRAQWRSP